MDSWAYFCYHLGSVLFLFSVFCDALTFGGSENSEKIHSFQHWLIPRDSIHTFDMQTNQSWVHTLTSLLLSGSWNLGHHLTALNHPKTRYQTIRNDLYTPEPANFFQLSNLKPVYLALLIPSHRNYSKALPVFSLLPLLPDWHWCFPLSPHMSWYVPSSWDL